jgi:hypothetical protein
MEIFRVSKLLFPHAGISFQMKRDVPIRDVLKRTYKRNVMQKILMSFSAWGNRNKDLEQILFK